MVTPTMTEMAMRMATQWVMAKQKPTGIQTVMTTPPATRHLHQATHPNARPTLIPSAHPGKHSAAAKPPEMHWALPASSLVLALHPHSVKLMRSAMPKQKKWAKAMSTPLHPTPRGWEPESA